MSVIHWNHLKISKRAVRVIALAVLAVAVLAAGFGAGYRAGTEHPKHIIVKGITNVGDNDVTADFGLFWEVREKLKGEHIDGASFKDQDMVYGAISGMVDAMGDPNTVFLKPVISKKFEEDIRGEFGGIGAEIARKDAHIVVVAPLEASPAEKAGLRAGDIILKVDDKNVENADVNEAVTYIRGPIGTKVTLTVIRPSEEHVREIAIVRDTIRVPTVKLTLKDNHIAHLQLFSFNENASVAFYQAIAKAAQLGTNGIVLDLRNDPGGFLEVAVNLAGWFLEPGTLVVSEEFRSGDKNEFKTSGNGVLKNVPVVVLVNGGSASASEILAGALRDQRHVKLVGEKTFGKGTVQELETLSDGESKLKVTIAHWKLPGGSFIDKNGIPPDVEVKLTEEDTKAKKDPQLDRAIQVLNEEINKVVTK